MESRMESRTRGWRSLSKAVWIWGNWGRMKHRIGLGMRGGMKKIFFYCCGRKKFSFWERKKFSFCMGYEKIFHFGDISGKLF